MIGLGLGGGGGGFDQAMTLVGLLGADAMVGDLDRIAGAWGKVDEAQSKASRSGAMMQRLGLGMTGLSGGMIAAGIAAIKSANDIVESESLVATVYGNSTAQIQRWSEARRQALGVNSYEQRRVAGGFQIQFLAGGLDPSKALKMSEAFTEMRDDLVSFYNVADSKEAFQALQSGINGEAEPLRRFGIFLSEANIKQYALAHGIGQANRELSEQEKVVARAGFILESFNKSKAKGDLERTKDSPANQLRRMRNEGQQALADLGMALIPIEKDLIEIGKQIVPPIKSAVTWFASLDENTRKWGVSLAVAAGPLLWLAGKGVSLAAMWKIARSGKDDGGVPGAVSTALGGKAVGVMTVHAGVVNIHGALPGGGLPGLPGLPGGAGAPGAPGLPGSAGPPAAPGAPRPRRWGRAALWGTAGALVGYGLHQAWQANQQAEEEEETGAPPTGAAPGSARAKKPRAPQRPSLLDTVLGSEYLPLVFGGASALASLRGSSRMGARGPALATVPPDLAGSTSAPAPPGRAPRLGRGLAIGATGAIVAAGLYQAWRARQEEEETGAPPTGAAPGEDSGASAPPAKPKPRQPEPKPRQTNILDTILGNEYLPLVLTALTLLPALRGGGLRGAAGGAANIALSTVATGAPPSTPPSGAVAPGLGGALGALTIRAGVVNLYGPVMGSRGDAPDTEEGGVVESVKETVKEKVTEKIQEKIEEKAESALSSAATAATAGAVAGGARRLPGGGYGRMAAEGSLLARLFPYGYATRGVTPLSLRGLGMVARSPGAVGVGVGVGLAGAEGLRRYRQSQETARIEQANQADTEAVKQGKMTQAQAAQRQAQRENQRTTAGSFGEMAGNTGRRLLDAGKFVLSGGAKGWDYRRGQFMSDTRQQLQTGHELYTADVEKTRQEADEWAEKNKKSKAEADVRYWQNMVKVEKNWAGQYSQNLDAAGMAEHVQRMQDARKNAAQAQGQYMDDWRESNNRTATEAERQQRNVEAWRGMGYGEKQIQGLLAAAPATPEQAKAAEKRRMASYFKRGVWVQDEAREGSQNPRRVNLSEEGRRAALASWEKEYDASHGTGKKAERKAEPWDKDTARVAALFGITPTVPKTRTALAPKIAARHGWESEQEQMATEREAERQFANETFGGEAGGAATATPLAQGNARRQRDLSIAISFAPLTVPAGPADEEHRAQRTRNYQPLPHMA